MQRGGYPNEVAEAVYWLLSEKASLLLVRLSMLLAEDSNFIVNKVFIKVSI